MKKTKVFQIPFKKVVWGYLEVEAYSKQDAIDGNYLQELDEYDNKSDYDFDYDKIEEIK